MLYNVKPTLNISASGINLAPIKMGGGGVQVRNWPWNAHKTYHSLKI